MNRNSLVYPSESNKIENVDLYSSLREACKKIAPVWPLENFVAVNPYMGLSHQKFEDVAQYLSRIGGIKMTLPVSFYKDKIRDGKITQEDIAEALAKKPYGMNLSVGKFMSTLDHSHEENVEKRTVATLIDTAGVVTKQDWNRFTTSRISTWAASYFDNGQAAWAAADKNSKLFQAWKTEAGIDLTPEIMGLKNFRKKVKALPDQPLEAATYSLKILGVPEEGLQTYLHGLLLRVGGWAAYAARIDWDNRLYGGEEGTLIEFLAVLISWEACLLQCLDSLRLRSEWEAAKKRLLEVNSKNEINYPLAYKIILQDAFDCATQREIMNTFQGTKSSNLESYRLKAQAVFCIDVRSEVYRRNLEMIDPKIETLGFAGFFAFPIQYIPIGHNSGQAQCPVLLKTGPVILEQTHDENNRRRAYESRVQRHHLQQIWRSFKSGAVTCFSFVSPLGLSFLPKLFTDSFGMTRPVPHPDKVGLQDKFVLDKSISLEVATHENVHVGIPLEQRKQLARNALTAMSLTDNFARFVLIVGHGSTTVNNPHATGLDCGACGGHSGEANARVAAAVLNDLEVRIYLREEGILIPDDTIFLACLHDTTTDEVMIYNKHEVQSDRKNELHELEQSLQLAATAARNERALRMSITEDIDSNIMMRSKDWSQVRPEWGLAGCSSFIVAPRKRTKDIRLSGRSFLHSYEWEKDRNFSVLELIMTAPMIVTSWISLQYFASTVDNKNFGSGNKTLHNVTAGVGVLEGFSGDLRVGLPMQSVHDGEMYQHEPVRLNVIIEAPIEAMNSIIKKHESVRNLLDNGWMNLLAMNDEGKVSHRYRGDLKWECVAE